MEEVPMDCPSCHSEAPENSKFCDRCGSPLPVRCAACGTVNRSGARFCSSCGKWLSADAAARAEGKLQLPSSRAQASPSPERRHVTVMFCDLVGSTALSSRMDPE